MHKILRVYDNSGTLGSVELPNHFVIKPINIKNLPNQNVIRANHGKDMSVFVNDSQTFNLSDHLKNIKNWTYTDYGLLTAQFSYSFTTAQLFI